MSCKSLWAVCINYLSWKHELHTHKKMLWYFTTLTFPPRFLASLLATLQRFVSVVHQTPAITGTRSRLRRTGGSLVRGSRKMWNCSVHASRLLKCIFMNTWIHEYIIPSLLFESNIKHFKEGKCAAWVIWKRKINLCLIFGRVKQACAAPGEGYFPNLFPNDIFSSVHIQISTDFCLKKKY